MNLTSKIILITIGTISLYAGFVIFSDISLLLEKIERFDIRILITSLLLVSSAYFLRVMRWNILLHSAEINIPKRKSMIIFFAGLAFGITPGKLGEIVKTHFLKSNYDIPTSKTLPIVFIERYYDLIGIICLSLIGIWFIDYSKTQAIVLFTAMIILIILSKQRKIVMPILLKFEQISGLKKIFTNSSETYATAQFLLTKKIFAQSIGLSIGGWFLESIAVYLIFQGFGINLNIITTLFVYAISSIIGSLSMLPGGIGLTEGGMMGLLMSQKVNYTAAFVSVLLVRLVTLWYSVILGLIAFKGVNKR